ncbi:MAG: ribokinase [Johnsonella sp.]|nr:ribokinase [Johnsonella sp.]
MKVLSFGSLNIDYVYAVEHFVRAGETISSKSMEIFGGGKGLNQSIALSKAGCEVYHAGKIGSDGLFLKQMLEDYGVNTDLIRIDSSQRTGNAIIQNDRAGDNCILLYAGANRAIEKEFIDETLEAFAKGDWIVLQNEVSNLDYMIEAASKKGLKIVLNPSPMDEFIQALDLDKIDLMILNETEAMRICSLYQQEEQEGKSEEEIEEYLIKTIREKLPFPETVLTLGEKGAVYIAKDKLIRQEAYQVQAIDTTAAGDTFTGFYIGSILKGEEIKEALDRAALAASLAVTVKGAANSIPCLEEINKLKQKL